MVRNLKSKIFPTLIILILLGCLFTFTTHLTTAIGNIFAAEKL